MLFFPVLPQYLQVANQRHDGVDGLMISMEVREGEIDVKLVLPLPPYDGERLYAR